jgi:hypothetical protein
VDGGSPLQVICLERLGKTTDGLRIWAYINKAYSSKSVRATPVWFMSEVGIYKILARILLNNLGCIFWNLKHEFIHERNRNS